MDQTILRDPGHFHPESLLVGWVPLPTVSQSPAQPIPCRLLHSVANLAPRTHHWRKGIEGIGPLDGWQYRR